MVSLTTPITEAPLAVLDVETTGLHPENGDRVVEVAVARSVGGEVLETFVSLVNPERPIGPSAMRVHGITDAMVAVAPRFADVADEVLRLLSGAIMVGHNAPFDLGFVSAELFIAGRAMPRLVALDTLRLARHLYTLGSYALGAVSAAMQVYVDTPAHRALADVLLTHGVLQVIIQDLWPEGICTVQDYVQVQGGGLEFGAVAPERVPGPIRQALAEGKMLWIAYASEGGQQTRRIVRPLQVIERPTGLYLDAYCQLRQARRTFRLDRIIEMDVIARF
ncbi:MAG: WYL domain-containing protein [Chloroflexi bacterium]|jgi:DNA polymerase-3 subunit epsilon|nr:WYL domain-containing protein [Chloroflexota bacterium]